MRKIGELTKQELIDEINKYTIMNKNLKIVCNDNPNESKLQEMLNKQEKHLKDLKWIYKYRLKHDNWEKQN